VKAASARLFFVVFFFIVFSWKGPVFPAGSLYGPGTGEKWKGTM
jgi:hypothetical protein